MAQSNSSFLQKASPHSSGPVRPAPPPPLQRLADSKAKHGSLERVQDVTARDAAPPRPSVDPRKKKAAPPRPPLPSAVAQLKTIQTAVTFTGLLQPKKQNCLLTTSSSSPSFITSGPDMLINWDSPPTSPTPGRSACSSGDGLSLRSFGSESSSSSLNTLTTAPCGLTDAVHHRQQQARSESGFESETDVWAENVTSNGPLASQPPVIESVNSKPFSVPTIIRPNKSGNKLLPQSSLGESTHLRALEKTASVVIPAVSPQPVEGTAGHLADLLSLDNRDDEWSDGELDHSPPEPAVPPPSPPSLSESVEDDASAPSAVALFDYTSSHPGDLNFREGDVILLKSQVNEEWFRGSLAGEEGIFPVNFVRVVVPLEDLSTATASSSQAASATYQAVAVYAFEAETSEDLQLQVGDVVEVISCLGNGWLYGRQCQSGQQGQFPEAFVRRQQ